MPPAGPTGDGPGSTGPLPRDFRWLWGAYGATNLADGVLLAAGPLLVTSLTREPFAVAAAVLVQQLPWLVLGLLAGVVVDRVDRRRLMMAADAARVVVLVGLVATVVTGAVSLPVIYVALFLIGCAEVFADNAGGTLVAATVPARQLGRANSRLAGTAVITNKLAGPPLGALLFSAGAALPFGVDVVLLALGAVLVSRMHTDGYGEGRPTEHGRIRSDLADGLRWLRGNPPMRRLVVLIVAFNLSFGAVAPLWVLYALERLGLDEVGFGLLLTASAVGGVAGSALYPRLEARFSNARLLRFGLLVETATHLVFVTTSSWAATATILVLFGLHEAVWGSLSATIRQKLVPERLLGRVSSVYIVAVFAPFVVGTLLGGWLADAFGLLAPFWYAFIGAAVATVWAWRGLVDLNTEA